MLPSLSSKDKRHIDREIPCQTYYKEHSTSQNKNFREEKEERVGGGTGQWVAAVGVGTV